MKTKKKKNLPTLVLIITSVIVLSCNSGIEPFPEPPDPGLTGFSGTITFVGDWPQDVTRTHLVVFRNPINSSADFLPPNMSFIVDPVPSGAREFSFNSTEDSFQDLFTIGAGTYRYIAVAQSNTEDISLLRSDWVVVGVYYSQGNTSSPGVMTIEEGKITENINIVCDFDNPPPQPPGGILNNSEVKQ